MERRIGSTQRAHHRLGENGQLRTDVAVSDDAECLPSNLVAALGDLLPITSAQLRGSIDQLAGEGNGLANDELSD